MNPRWIQLIGSLVAMVMIANLQYAWTLFVQPIREATGWKLSEVQWGFTLFILFETWIMPVEGWLIDRMGPRIFITIAGVLCGVGWTALGFVSELWQLYLFYSIAGVGAAFVYSGSIATALKWFPDRRGLASGIIAAGFGSGSAAFIPIIAHIIQHYSYRQAFLVTGIVQGVLIIVAAQVLRNPGPEFSKDFGKDLAGRKQSGGRVSGARRNTEPFTTGEMLATPHFYVLYAMFLMMAIGGLLVTAQTAPMAAAWKIPVAWITAALALSRVANGVSRIFWGWLSDRIGRETVMFVSFTIQSGCLLSILWPGRLSGPLFVLALVLTNLTWGQIFSVFPAITGDYYGARNAASNYSFLYSAKGVASIIGGGLGALMFEKFGSWSAVFYGSAALALLSGLLALALKAAPLPAKARQS